VDGELELRDVDGACRLIRETDRSGVSRTRVTWLSGDRFHSHWLASLRGGLSSDLLTELMLPSQDQAIRWRRLEELCRGLEATEAVDPAGLQRATRALELAIRERDGNGVHGGVVHRISELRRRQGELQSALSQLRRPAGDLPARIERLAAEFDARTAALERAGLRLSEIESEIARLEQWLVELRSRNTLPLDRTALESAIQRLTKQQTRFREIRTMIAAESSTVRKGGVASSGSPLSELVTLRALVSRLESRLHLAGTSAGAESGLDPARSELAALCQYLRGHEQAVIEHLEALQSQFCETAMQDLAAVEELLESRLAALRTERDRADNVLAISGDAPVCTFSGHSLLRRTGSAQVGSIRTIAEAEARLASLRDEQQHLLRQRPELEAARTDLLAQLERLRRELSQAASLEQIDGLRSALAELDAEIAVLEDQRRLLDRSEVSLREVIDRLQAAPSSAVIEIAGAFLMRLSSGALRGVRLTHQGLMVFVSGRGEAVDWTVLSDAQREQATLAIRLAAASVGDCPGAASRRVTSWAADPGADEVFDHRTGCTATGGGCPVAEAA
jgi:DNA repair exonuclease SbcCD ATPase subunit